MYTPDEAGCTLDDARGRGMKTVLLGPQRFRTTVGAVMRKVAPGGAVATVTAGWRDRESDTDELDATLDGRGQHLYLYGRLADVLDSDRRFAAAALAHRDAVDELAGIYSLRLQRGSIASIPCSGAPSGPTSTRTSPRSCPRDRGWSTSSNWSAASTGSSTRTTRSTPGSRTGHSAPALCSRPRGTRCPDWVYLPARSGPWCATR